MNNSRASKDLFWNYNANRSPDDAMQTIDPPTPPGGVFIGFGGPRAHGHTPDDAIQVTDFARASRRVFIKFEGSQTHGHSPTRRPRGTRPRGPAADTGDWIGYFLRASKGAVLILLAAACGHAQQPHKRAPSARGDALRDEIVAQERAGLDALKTGDLTAFANSTADDAVFVDAAGPAGKAEVLKNTANFRLSDYTMSDVRFVPLSRDSGLIVYRLAESGTSHGKEFTGKVNVSSLWLKRGGKWVCVFSQETGAK